MRHFIIAIGREYGSGGAEIANLVAEKLGVTCYDRKLIDLAVEQTGFVEESLLNEDESMTTLKKSLLSINSYSTPLISDALMAAECDIIRGLAESEESCVIVGRCADYVLEERSDVFNVFICADDDYKTKRVMADKELDYNKAHRYLHKMTSQRAGYYKYVTGDEMGNNQRTMLKVRSSSVGGSERAAEIIVAAAKIIFGE